MRSYRFLLSRRWAVFGLVVVLLAAFAWWLGEWQFSRLHDREAKNDRIVANELREPAPVADVLSTERDVDPDDEWRRVEATGVYDVENTVVVRYRNNEDGAPGIDVVVPLVTEDGTALVVDRGFLATESRNATAADVPDAPTGEVTVVGWVRVDGTGDSTRVDELSTRAISSDEIGEATGHPVYDGFVDLVSEDPAPATSLELRPLPELGQGPHFFYGLQWWFFGVLALFGFGYLAYDERKRGRGAARPWSRRRQSAEGADDPDDPDAPADDVTTAGPPESPRSDSTVGASSRN